ncbi:lysophospholipid acyltransferase family protein [Endozoicomonas elysicola]|uniref:Lipid A biosynthesis (KDO)2-(Lauroyl)-lipid IVA acyltransferase n=1 Tax=Endozoicomonas elysicola TaxID=305900 RepID=A0A081K6Y7_9GAMM|nr:lysophospholipid acyltransferase family protein [Endozoicomonas elysicola]KEI69913.1 lipid A biosynthesis (KDO)2-(lauroyl)-lipid IVA acyltransferase [Endozoicomonas elysicola]
MLIGFLRLLSVLPFFLLYLMSSMVSAALLYIFRYRKDVVRNNIRQAFPGKNEKEVLFLTRAFYQYLADLSVEIIKARAMSAVDFKNRCAVIGGDKLIRETERERNPVIVLTIHQGNWEWMLHAVSQHLGVPIDPVYKPLHHKGWDQFIHEIRSRFNSRPIPMKQAGRDILKRKNGFRLFVMLADQTPVEGERGYWVSYLNKEAPFYLGAEKIAYLTQYPVFFAQCRRLKRGYYELEFKELAVPPYENTRDKNNHQIIDAYVRAAEEAIYEQPETFLWSHRRWKRHRDNDTLSEKV